MAISCLAMTACGRLKHEPVHPDFDGCETTEHVSYAHSIQLDLLGEGSEPSNPTSAGHITSGGALEHFGSLGPAEQMRAGQLGVLAAELSLHVPNKPDEIHRFNLDFFEHNGVPQRNMEETVQPSILTLAHIKKVAPTPITPASETGLIFINFVTREPDLWGEWIETKAPWRSTYEIKSVPGQVPEFRVNDTLEPFNTVDDRHMQGVVHSADPNGSGLSLVFNAAIAKHVNISRCK